MKRNSTIFLQILTVLIGVGVLAFILLEPQFEGRNVNASLFEIYFKDAFLAWTYLGSIAFFTALYQVFKLLGYIRENKILSSNSMKALRTIKYSATVLLGFILAAEAYLFIAQPGDDIAGGVFMGLLVIVFSGTVAAVATRFEKNLKRAVM